MKKHPVYHSCVLLVEDVEKSKHFYNVVLGQKIVMDFGENVSFEGGLAIWEKDYALNLIFKEKAKKINVGTNSFEIYFEIEDPDNLYELLMKEKVTVIHPVTEHPWGQRAFRARDPDGHIIEFGESMESAVRRLNMQGLSLEEIAKKSLMPMEFIKMALKNNNTT
jgi:catechol 2,3-dioxygenase-like lactoylglutathione lyase family enzyme